MPPDADDAEPFACPCGERYPTRVELVRHHVEQHARTDDASRQQVDESYPGR